MSLACSLQGAVLSARSLPVSLSPLPTVFTSRKRPAEEREREGNMIRPDHWYFPEKFILLMDTLAKHLNLKNGADYLVKILGKSLFSAFLNQKPLKPIIGSVTATVTGQHKGQPVETQVTSLLGGKQILEAWTTCIQNAQHSIQVALYDFDNLEMGGGRQPDGADIHPYWQLQQAMLNSLLAKAREFKTKNQGGKVQLILDASKEQAYDAYGNLIEFSPNKKFKINNQEFVDKLRKLAKDEQLPLEILHYPRELAKLYHVKLLVVDGQQAIIGGMNMSNHSPANWDTCVLLDGPEVANLAQATFYEDWVVGRYYEDKRKGALFKDISAPGASDIERYRSELPPLSERVSNPGIQILNSTPREYQPFGFSPREEVGDYLKKLFADPQLKEIMAEQFVFTHKALTENLLKRTKDDTLNARFLHSLGVIQAFPYTRKASHRLYDANLLRFYKEDEATQEKLHSKLFIFRKKKRQWEIFIGSPNTSKVGIETNVQEGLRDDSPVTNERFQRGNREVAIVIPSNKLAEPFEKQFEIDWKHSEPPTMASETQEAWNNPNTLVGAHERVAHLMPQLGSFADARKHLPNLIATA